MTLKLIRLELARIQGHPDGDPSHAYEFRAPLDKGGRIDMAAYPDVKELCVVRHFEKGVEQEKGLLVQPTAGKWAFSYALGDEDDEALFRFSSHTFNPGEYVSITEHDGEQRTFRVATVADWHPLHPK